MVTGGSTTKENVVALANEVTLYGGVLESTMDIDHSTNPLNILIAEEDEAGLNDEDLSTLQPNIKLNSKTVLIRRHKMSLSNLDGFINQTQPIMPLFESATHISVNLCRALARTAVSEAINATQFIHRTSKDIQHAIDEVEKTGDDIKIAEFRESEKYTKLADKLARAEDRYQEAISMYGHYVKAIPETQRVVELNNGITISVIPVDMVDFLSQPNNNDLTEELDFNDVGVKYIQEKMHKSKALMNAAQLKKLERKAEQSKQRASYVMSIKEELVKDLTDELNSEANDSFDIDEVLYASGLRKLERKLSEEITKSFSYILDSNTSVEVKNNAMNNDPLIEDVLENVKKALSSINISKERSSDAIEENGVAIVF